MPDHKPDYKPAEYRELMQIFIREWQAALTPSEFGVLLFIFDRTFGWRGEQEYVTRKQISGGVWAKEGDRCFSNGTGMSERTANRALKSLQDKGAILYKRTAHANIYSVNYEWEPGTMKTPKSGEYRRKNTPQERPKKEAKSGQSGVPKRHSAECQNGIQRKVQRRRESIKDTSPADAIRRVVEESEKKAESVLGLAKKKSIVTYNDSKSVWKALVASFSEDELPAALAHPMACALWNYGKDYQDRLESKTAAPFYDFLEWSIKNWRTIIDCEMAWMDGKSIRPEAGFFVKFSRFFEKAYLRRNDLLRMSKLTLWEQHVANALAAGKDQETAEKSADQLTGLTKERQALQRERAAMQTARVNEQRLAKVEVLSDIKTRVHNDQATRRAEAAKRIMEKVGRDKGRNTRPLGEWEEVSS